MKVPAMLICLAFGFGSFQLHAETPQQDTPNVCATEEEGSVEELKEQLRCVTRCTSISSTNSDDEVQTCVKSCTTTLDDNEEISDSERKRGLMNKIVCHLKKSNERSKKDSGIGLLPFLLLFLIAFKII